MDAAPIRSAIWATEGERWGSWQRVEMRVWNGCKVAAKRGGETARERWKYSGVIFGFIWSVIDNEINGYDEVSILPIDHVDKFSVQSTVQNWLTSTYNPKTSDLRFYGCKSPLPNYTVDMFIRPKKRKGILACLNEFFLEVAYIFTDWRYIVKICYWNLWVCKKR